MMRKECYAVSYKDKDGFFHNCVDGQGRYLIANSHDAALNAMCDHIDYLRKLLWGRPKYQTVPKKFLGLTYGSKIVKAGVEWDIAEYEKDLINRELSTIQVRKVRVM